MGGGSNNAQKQAEQNERERQRQIAASTGAINRIYDDPSRQAQYDQLSQDTTKFYMTDLDRQKEQNDRRLRFSLARSGNIGGSVQADQSRQLGEDYLKGVVEATRRGQQAGANLRGQDEQSRMNLIAMAQSGLDATTAGSRAASSMRSNLQSAMGESTANTLGNAFGSFSDIFNKSEEQKAQRQGWKYAYDTLYGKPMYGGY